MNKKKSFPVYVSSAYEGLEPYRDAVNAALLRMEKSVKAMEFFGSKPGTPKEVSLKNIDKCKVYIGIVGMRYGTIDPETGKSITHLEYEESQRRGLCALIYLIDEKNQPVLPIYMDTGKKAQKLKAFKDNLKKNHLVSPFTTPENLVSRVLQDLPEALEQIGADVKKDEIKISQSHNQLIKAYEELKALDKLKNDIIANMTHEMGTPMTLCREAIELAMTEKDEKERYRMLHIAKRAFHKQEKLIRDFRESLKV